MQTRRGINGRWEAAVARGLAAAAALALACFVGAAGALSSQTPSGQRSADDTMDLARFERWLTAFRDRAAADGITAQTLEAATTELSPDTDILERLNTQPEFSRTVGDYFASAVSKTRLAQGRARLADEGQLLERIENTYGVDRHVLIAIWGLESSYGANLGTRDVFKSLATLAFAADRRQAFWEAQLLAALRIVQEDGVNRDDMKGSWAAAMGHTQFIPTTYRRHAVDFDGDGRKDLRGSHADALASAANYLARSGWAPAKPWGFEVRLPDGFDYVRAGRDTQRSVAQWSELGVVPADVKATLRATADGSDGPQAPQAAPSSPLAIRGADSGDMGSILLPSGAGGPAFLVLNNFGVILRYNQATSYALAVGHLSDRLAGGAALNARWPENDRPLSRSQRVTLQERLTAAGHDTGGIDGIIGPMSRRAIRAAQQELGMTPDGHPTPELLHALADPPLPLAKLSGDAKPTQQRQ